MLSSEDIGATLGATRVIPLSLPKLSGPLGWMQLAHTIQQLQQSRASEHGEAIVLPPDAWNRLNEAAKTMSAQVSRPVAPAELAIAFVMQGLDNACGR